jgi:anti-anti-sigma regulatory factor
MLRIREPVHSHSETTLHVEGRIVSEWVGVLQEECGRALQEPGRRLRLDLRGVTFIDPSGVRALRSLPTDRVTIVHALDFIDALLKGDGTS